MKRLHAPIHHLGEAGERLDRDHRNPRRRSSAVAAPVETISTPNDASVRAKG
jgi:hypothetical protein